MSALSVNEKENITHSNIIPTDPSQPINHEAYHAKRYRILLVEDNLMHQKTSLKQLNVLGFEQIDLASNGEEAINTFSKTHYDLILMDCEMPIMNGYDASLAIREKNECVPIIGYTSSDNKEKCLAAKMNACLLKPSQTQALGKVLSAWLDRK
jgi:CheY-like chemotaxis protein